MFVRRVVLGNLLLIALVGLVACARPAAVSGPGTAALSPDAQKALGPDGDQLVPARYVMEAYKGGLEIVFVDARTPLDYEFGHIAGAINVPYFEADKHIGQLDKSRLYIVYCECPHAEAVQVADAMTASGFGHVKVIDEGMNGWTQEGGELVGATATGGAPTSPPPSGRPAAATPATTP